jgi:L(+)-tartrate dehydratase alpha subunit
MFRDLDLAEEQNVPLCQDTGVIQYFIELGANFPIRSGLEECLREATRRATKEAPLRHNAVQIFSERNSGNNTGRRIPWLEVEIVPDSDECVIYGYMAGGGCSLPGTAKVLMPVEGYEGIVQYVFDTICERGINACPPLLVGVGIAGSVEVAAMLSKKALLRPVGSHNPSERGADFERMIEEGLNRLNMGPGGLTGVKTVLGVNVEDAARHPSCLAVGISTGCWAHRRAAIRFKSDLSYELLTHKGQTL